MKLKFLYPLVLAILFGSTLWGQSSTEGPIKVEIREENGGWKLYRGGEPYYIKGVGGKEYLDKAQAYGANSMRLWSAGGAQEALDEAHERGMTVLFGLWVGQERQGFDYDDGKAVKAQLEKFRQIVKTYKDHPAILMWGIGNENDLFYSDFKVWDAINDIAKMIHEEDPNHPTMTVTAGLDIAEIQLIQDRAPHLDVYGINTYGELLTIKRGIRSGGWEGAYVITEWGPTGHWEVPKTAWGAPIEQTSTEKAASYMERYQKGITDDQEMCVGSYVFLWGNKQETTATWYGLFLPDGTETSVMDVLEYNWSGRWPENRSPEVNDFKINNKSMSQNVFVSPSQKVFAEVNVSDQDNDKIDYQWEVVPESTDIRTGGDAESSPEPVKVKVFENENGKFTFKAPIKQGPYRLFLYAYDGNGNAATANFPFYIGEYGQGSR